MGPYIACCVCNFCLMALIGFTVYCTGSAWPLWAILAAFSVGKSDGKEDAEEKTGVEIGCEPKDAK